MEKYLFFNTGSNDSLCLPARRLTDMGMESDGASLILHFIAAFEGNDGVGEITVDLTIADKNPFVTIIDDTTGEKVHTDVTSCGAITDFA